MTIINKSESHDLRDYKEFNLNLLANKNWRTSLVQAVAVIPAPIAYIKVVAVKKLVVEILNVTTVASVVIMAFIRLKTAFDLYWSV